MTLDVQTGLTTPPKSHYSPVVSRCQVQFVLLCESEKNDARLMLAMTDELGPRTNEKRRESSDDDGDDNENYDDDDDDNGKDDGDDDDAPYISSELHINQIVLN